MLPMIAPPKPYGKNVLGGYLLNDINFREELFISKTGYALKSEVKGDRIVDMINKINSIPFKINKVLLEFVFNNADEYNLLIDNTVKHKFAELYNLGTLY